MGIQDWQGREGHNERQGEQVEERKWREDGRTGMKTGRETRGEGRSDGRRSKTGMQTGREEQKKRGGENAHDGVLGSVCGHAEVARRRVGDHVQREHCCENVSDHSVDVRDGHSAVRYCLRKKGAEPCARACACACVCLRVSMNVRRRVSMNVSVGESVCQLSVHVCVCQCVYE